jgi:hypothetical protein
MTKEDFDRQAAQCFANIEAISRSIRSTAGVSQGFVNAIHRGYGDELQHSITAIKTNLRVVERMFKGAY